MSFKSTKPPKKVSVALKSLDPLPNGGPARMPDALLDLWPTLRSTSIEAAQGPSTIFEFQEQCMYFTTIVDDSDIVEDNSRQFGQGEWETFPQDVYNLDLFGETASPTNGHIAPDVFGTDNDWWEEKAPKPPVTVLPPTWTSLSTKAPKTIGLLYALPSMHSRYSDMEAQFGLALTEEYQGKGYGSTAALQALKTIFEEFCFHRVQVLVMESKNWEHALKLFTKLGFGHEGTRRRSFLDPVENKWKDVTYLAMLDTEWMIRSTNLGLTAPKSLWDELFFRHQREREALLRWEERNLKTTIKRTASAETLRVVPVKRQSELFQLSDGEKEAESASDDDSWLSSGHSNSPPPRSESDVESMFWDETPSSPEPSPSDDSDPFTDGINRSPTVSSLMSDWDELSTDSCSESSLLNMTHSEDDID